MNERERSPNHLLREARRRQSSPSGSGRPMSRQDLADALNAYLAGHDDARYRREATFEARYIGKLERGEHRWLNDMRREAFRHVLKAGTDAELGFWIIRGLKSESAAPAEEWSSDHGSVAATGRDTGDGNVKRRTLLVRTAALGVAAPLTPRALLWHAAHSSAALSAAAEDKRIAPITLDHAHDDLRRLTTDYVATSDLPRILTEAVLLRDRLADLLDRHADRELCILMGGSCLLLASISHDAGESDAGMMQARAAEIYCAELLVS